MYRRTGVFLLFLSILYGHAIAQSNFDVLIFTQHWPQTVCYLWKESSASHTCSLPRDNDEWTIHGLWPSEYHKLGPQFCNRSLPFNETALKPLWSQLQEKWIDVEYGRESSSLWKHEWEKHGTCSTMLENVNTEVKYFKKGLDLLSQYDMKNVLAKAQILPGNSYAMTDIFNAIQRILGKRGTVICQKDKKTKKSYIFEIRICFNKNFELIDCDGVYGYPTNCDRSTNVIYPGEVPHNYHVVRV
ncbi:ribonuclease Oy [Hylaeus anthracinus]|uniref:ribonuclease Oy n=1 Tax=Hylaeus anthracinus TaxID=313031 RepID=UPI0023BA1CBD|nr:ribonuclease Oy [Hylaeus anthracinus]